MSHIVSWAPEDFVKGGLLNDVDVEFTNCRFGMGQYANGVTTPAFIADLIVLDKDGKPTNEIDADNFWSVGKVEDWGPTDDGKSLVAKGTSQSIRTGSNFNIFILELTRVGMKLSPGLSTDISTLNGLRVHLLRTKVKRSGSGMKEESEVLTPTSLIALPGQKSTHGSSHANGLAGAGAGAGTALDPGEVEAKALEFMTGEAKKNGGTITWMNCRKAAIMALMKQGPLRTAVVAKIEDTNWRSQQNTFVMDGDNVVAV